MKLPINNIIILVLSFLTMSKGIEYILISKDKMKVKLVNEKRKKLFFCLGVVVLLFGLLLFLFFLVSVCL
jgi:hypothetical protein